MVILGAAALGATGYGLYKGGEEGVKKGKECHREMQREQKRSSQRSDLREKGKSRSNRIAEIVQMKQNLGSSSSSSSSLRTATTSTSWNGGSGLSRFSFASNGSSRTAPRTTYTDRQLADKEENEEINDRHRNVMQRLKASRVEERKKGNNKLLSLNPFKKK